MEADPAKGAGAEAPEDEAIVGTSAARVPDRARAQGCDAVPHAVGAKGSVLFMGRLLPAMDAVLSGRALEVRVAAERVRGNRP